ncbi:MAG TPA: D-alanyl-D-alanine carboxypeptidase, partial [Bacteroidota bacterium]|nr:D-alanyl-D-alanine carboxypeptidase [Bacteroidota bacterium]
MASGKGSALKSNAGEKTTLSTLREEIHKILDDPQFASTLTGIEIVSLKDGKTVFSQNPGKLFHPASNMKILTTSAAMAELGTFKYHTILSTNGRIADSTLHGSLFVKGGGDGIFSMENIDSLSASIAG